MLSCVHASISNEGASAMLTDSKDNESLCIDKAVDIRFHRNPRFRTRVRRYEFVLNFIIPGFRNLIS